jgi:hypothetical protein
MSEGALHIDPHDSLGKKIGLLAAILAVSLSVFTISAHRAHTATIILQTEANDSWSHYQAKRIRDSQLEFNIDILKTLAPNNANATALIESYVKKHEEYSKELDEIKLEADIAVHRSELSETRALYFDLAEGILEIALVMSSLYFIAHKKLFPMFGIFFGIIGTVAGILGFLL